MDEEIRKGLLQMLADAHSTVEKEYLKHPAKKEEAAWLEKRRLLLADLALHMAQAGVQKETDAQLIKRYLYSILTICSDFLPEEGIKEFASTLLEKVPETKD